MFIGGIQKNSMIDFPGKISCVLFLAGCNFKCPYCHNPDLVRCQAGYPLKIPEKRVIDFLKARRSMLDGVVISGGEPTLQPDLEALCRTIKNIGYPVKLDTNGSRPDVIHRLIQQGLLDYIAMDIKTDMEHYHCLTQTQENLALINDSIRIIMESGVLYEFKTTCVKPFVTEKVISNIAPIVYGARLYFIQQFKNTMVLEPRFCNQALPYPEQELLHFKSIIEPWVTQCMVR